MNKALTAVVIGLFLMFATAGSAVVIDTVPVGHPDNAGELSGAGAGAGAGNFGPDRICGSVGYAYNIGKYEVTAGQYTEFLNAVAKTDTYGLYNTGMSATNYGSEITRSGGGTVGNPYTYSMAAGFANRKRPVNYVSFWDACRFANWLHNGQPSGAQDAGTTERGAYTLDGYNGNDGRTIQRNANWKWAVTSEDEWYKAAYYDPNKLGGAGYWDYPTGSDTAPARDMADVSGNNANYYSGSDPYPIDSGKWTTVVGEFQNSDGPYGTFDQGGNVWEWNEAIGYQDSMYSSRGLRGGSFNGASYNLLASYRHYFYPADGSDTFGFRVSEVPEPGTMAVLALGGIGMLVRRRGVRG